RGLEGTGGDDGVREISLSLSEQTILSEAAHSRTTWSGTPGTNEGDHELLQKLGGDPPQRMIAIPLIARERTVAVLYADSAGLGPDAVNLEALETLVRVTGMAVELLASRRSTTAQTAEHTAAQAGAQPAPQPVEQTAPVAAAPAPAAEEPMAEPQPAAQPEQPAVAQADSAPIAHEEFAPPTHEEIAPPAHEEVAPPVFEAPAPVEAEAPALASPVETTTPPTAEQAFASPAQPTAAPQEERGIT